MRAASPCQEAPPELRRLPRGPRALHQRSLGGGRVTQSGRRQQRVARGWAAGARASHVVAAEEGEGAGTGGPPPRRVVASARHAHRHRRALLRALPFLFILFFFVSRALGLVSLGNGTSRLLCHLAPSLSVRASPCQGRRGDGERHRDGSAAGPSAGGVHLLSASPLLRRQPLAAAPRRSGGRGKGRVQTNLEQELL